VSDGLFDPSPSQLVFSTSRPVFVGTNCEALFQNVYFFTVVRANSVGCVCERWKMPHPLLRGVVAAAAMGCAHGVRMGAMCYCKLWRGPWFVV